jgi:hypothetical protein
MDLHVSCFAPKQQKKSKVQLNKFAHSVTQHNKLKYYILY